MSSDYQHRGIATCCGRLPIYNGHSELKCQLCKKTIGVIGGFDWLAYYWNKSFDVPKLWELSGYYPCRLRIQFEYWGRTDGYPELNHAAYKVLTRGPEAEPIVVALWVWPDKEVILNYPVTSSRRSRIWTIMIDGRVDYLEVSCVLARDQKQLVESGLVKSE